MLVLSRKINQSIVIDDQTVITITEITNDGVKIAIDAPRSVKILRKELVDSVVNDNKEAVNTVNRSQLKALLKNNNQ